MSNTTANPPLDEEYDSTGFISYQLSTLPIGLRAILSLLCIVIGLGLCTLSPYAARWGTHWGVKNNDTEVREEIDGKKSFKFRLGGGVLGIFTGALGAAYTILLLACAVLNTQDEPSLAPGTILAISIISAIVGAIIGGRWKPNSRLMLTYIGTISLTLLFSTSFRIKRKLGRLIVFIILLIINIITCFIFSIIPKNNVTFQRISNRLSFFLSSITGSWLFCSVGVDLFIGIGLLDSFTLLVSDNGIFKDGSSSTLASIEDGDDRIGFENVVKWNQGKCKGLLAGIWLLTIFGTAFQQWRYSVIGDDPEESWNTYLGSLLSNEKNLISRARNSSNNNGNNYNRAGYFSKSENWFKKLFISSSERKRRTMPATYTLPPEQVMPQEEQNENDVHHSSSRHTNNGTPLGLDDGSEEIMREAHTSDNGIMYERRRNPPARYDSFGYSSVGLGLYDIEGDGRDAYYSSSPYDAREGPPPSSSAPGGIYDGIRDSERRTNMLPRYNPELYSREKVQYALPRNDSEPFQCVPKYSPPRIEDSVPSSSSSTFPRAYASVPPGDAIAESTTLPSAVPEGTYMNRIVEEPEESDRMTDSQGETFIAPLSPQARALEGRSPTMRTTTNSNRNQVEPVPIPATPSLVNAIKRVSEAQAQARQYRMQEQQASLSIAHQTNQANISSPNFSSNTGLSDRSASIARIPESERTALKQAAIRRQASADWWAEVERKANEQAGKERRNPLNSLSGQRMSSAPSMRNKS